MYDAEADEYYELMNDRLVNDESFLKRNYDAILSMLGPLNGLEVCDLACGAGHLCHRMAELGAKVTGVDLSEKLLEHARRDGSGNGVRFIRDDAQQLTSMSDETFDLLVSNLALMDIENLGQVYASVSRVLKPGSRFVFSVMHPCFSGPFFESDGPPMELADDGSFIAWRVFRYVDEGHWHSPRSGLRSAVGAIHRMISTYINGLQEAGMILRRIKETTLPEGEYGTAPKQFSSKIARTLIVDAVKIS